LPWTSTRVSPRTSSRSRHAEGLKGRPEGAKLFLPPRAAGDGLWAHIQEAEDARLAAEAAAAAEAEAEAAYQALVAEALEKGEEPPPRPEPEVDEAAAENAEGEDAGDPPPPPPESDGSRNVLVTGAPFAMAAETATRAAEKYGVAPLDVDAVVREAAATAGELGDLVRLELGVPAPEAAEEASNDAETSPATESAAAPADAEEPLVEAPADVSDEDDFPEELESDAPEEGTLKISTLARVLSAAMNTRDEWKGGFVIGGLAWETASPATLVKALRRALGMRKAAPAPALPPADADPDAWEAPAEEEGAFALHSAKRLTVISLAIEDDAAGAREKRAKEEEARALRETAAEDGEETETTPEGSRAFRRAFRTRLDAVRLRARRGRRETPRASRDALAPVRVDDGVQSARASRDGGRRRVSGGRRRFARRRRRRRRARAAQAAGLDPAGRALRDRHRARGARRPRTGHGVPDPHARRAARATRRGRSA
jgi:hypothetical protein